MLPDVYDPSQIVAAILAGGLGMRLRPVVVDRPKALAEINGKPFLSYILDHFVSSGIRRVVLCTGYCHEQIEAAYGDTYKSLHITYSVETQPLGTGGAIRMALPYLDSDPVLILNGDSFINFDLGALWHWHAQHAAQGTLWLTRVDDSSRYGSVLTDDSGKIVRFNEKSGQVGAGWINSGVYLISHSILQDIPAGRRVSLEKEIFPVWAGRSLYGYPGNIPFIDIGTPESYLEAQEFFRTL